MPSSAPVTSPSFPTGSLMAFGRPVQRISVEQYHRMIDAGVFSRGERCELIRGVLLVKPVPKPPHSYAVEVLAELFRSLVGRGRLVRSQQPMTASDSEPEPDVAVATGTLRDYRTRHPRPDEMELVVEVADTTLREDRTAKYELYAEESIRCYWIVNLVNRCVEVHTQSRIGKKPGYRKTTVYKPGEMVPVFIDGAKIGEIAVDDILP